MRRFTSIRPYNPKRRAKNYERQYGEKADWIRGQGCATCSAPGPCDPSHVRSRGAGGTSDDLIPQCRPCHRELHQAGFCSFERKHGVDLEALAEECHRRWLANL